MPPSCWKIGMGEAPLLQLIADVLAREAELIGDNRARILRYTGCEQIM